MGVARLPPAQMTLMMESLVQPEEGLSGGRKGRDPPEEHGQCLRARGENCSGQTQRTSGCPGVPMGTSGSDPPLKGVRDVRRRQCLAACRAPHPWATLLGKAS